MIFTKEGEIERGNNTCEPKMLNHAEETEDDLLKCKPKEKTTTKRARNQTPKIRGPIRHKTNKKTKQNRMMQLVQKLDATFNQRWGRS